MTRARLALGVLAGYIAIAFLVGTRYPFSVFDMYSRPTDNASRILARVEGRVDEVDRFVAWRCEGEPDLCEQGGAISTSDPVDRELFAWVRAHPGQGEIPVELVRRIWRFSGDAVRVEDCLVQRCRAVRR
jgi:hypothetical protein